MTKEKSITGAVHHAGRVKAQFVIEAFDETEDDMTIIKNSPSWKTIRRALLLLDQAENGSADLKTTGEDEKGVDLDADITLVMQGLMGTGCA